MTPIRMERLESGVRTIIAFTEAFNRRDIASILELVSEECVYETPSPPPDGTARHGRAALNQYWQEFFAQFPQAHLKIEEAFGFGMRCISLWRLDRTDTAGNSSYLRGVDLFRVQDGLITEQLSYIKAEDFSFLNFSPNLDL